MPLNQSYRQHPGWRGRTVPKTAGFHFPMLFPSAAHGMLTGCLLACVAAATCVHADETARRTPLVQAVASCRDSVVNLRGQKPVTDLQPQSSAEETRHVNGMGTGVVIDSRGYVLTNFHVVQGVQNIQVTTRDNQQCWATLIAHDPVTDLALIRITSRTPLPEIRLGRSSDLMLAETVAAVGNAYGYEHTVTTGIVSHLNRTVQVNDHQIYENLIQTDAPINPGNSGGPLLNLDGEMIGINVAVRVGAQGIAFAIPVDRAIEVAARLIDDHMRGSVLHGLTVETDFSGLQPRALVRSVAAGSPAASAGIQPGEVIESADGRTVVRAVDFCRTVLDRRAGDRIRLQVRRGEEAPRTVDLVLSSSASSQVAVRQTSSVSPVDRPADLAWTSLGLRLVPTGPSEMLNRHPDYQRGLRVVEVRPGSPAAAEGIRADDILVAMHGWKTESIDNLQYVLALPEIGRGESFRFYVLRGREPFYGQMRTATH